MAYLAAAAAALQLVSTIGQGNAAKAQGKFAAEQYKRNASQTEAAAGVAAQNDKRQAQLVSSRAQAVSAASGAGGGETVPRIQANIAREGEYRALMDLWNGTSQADQMRGAANAARLQGQQAKKAAYLSGASTILSEGMSTYSKYGTSLKSPNQLQPYNTSTFPKRRPTTIPYG